MRVTSKNRTFSAVAASIAAHLTLLSAVSLRAQTLPASRELSTLRFSGQTFDVDSLSPVGNSQRRTVPGTKAETGVSEKPLPPPLPNIPREDESTQKEPTKQTSTEKVPTKENALSSRRQEENPHTVAHQSSENIIQQDASSLLSPGGAFGEEGPPAGTVDLFRAFLKTLPLAAKSDPSWLTLPLGDAGSLEFLITIDKDLRLKPIEIIERPEQPAPRHLKRMTLLNRNFLLRGRFALGAQSKNGSQRLRLSAVISHLDPDPENPDAPGVRAFGLRGGTVGKGAYFTYFSGKHVELHLKRVP